MAVNYPSISLTRGDACGRSADDVPRKVFFLKVVDASVTYPGRPDLGPSMLLLGILIIVSTYDSAGIENRIVQDRTR